MKSLVKRLQIPSEPDRSSMFETRSEEKVSATKQVNPLEDLVLEPTVQKETLVTNDLITPASKGKSKMDEVAEAAISIFGGRVLD